MDKETEALTEQHSQDISLLDLFVIAAENVRLLVVGPLRSGPFRARRPACDPTDLYRYHTDPSATAAAGCGCDSRLATRFLGGPYRHGWT